jgi:hypothetical protein
MSADAARVRLVDAPGEPGRTTATLVASLAARLGTLYLVSGADAVGSLAAGFCALGREVSRTAEGARLRRALESGRVGANGDSIWTTLLIGRWLSATPPSPVLDQLRNDVALVLADDLAETLALLPIPGEAAGERAQPLDEWTFADLVLGLWAFSRELVAAVEALAEPTLPPAGEVRVGAAPDERPDGELLR